MLQAKTELLAALAAELEKLSPGAGARAAFESPKVAAHGDFACTAAMQLAKPLKANPRQLGEQLRDALLAQLAAEPDSAAAIPAPVSATRAAAAPAGTAAGETAARAFRQQGLVEAAALFLHPQIQTLGPLALTPIPEPAHG